MTPDMESPQPRRIIGRYELHGPIAAGGMAMVHFGRLLGPVGFSRTVAIKRLHQQFARDPEFVAMFLDEAHLAGRIRHPNVVSTLDVVTTGDELFIVMEYVQGETLSRLLRTVSDRGERVPVPVACAIVSSMLQGLHAAHEATDDAGRPMGLVHRDVSPQNVLVGIDGGARVLDFGVAKAVGRVHHTRDSRIKGKLEYMAPERLLSAERDGRITRSVDVYAAGVVLWEALTGKSLFAGANEAQLLYQVLHAPRRKPSDVAPDVPAALDDVVMRAISPNQGERFDTAFEMALALEGATRTASAIEVGQWLREVAGEALARRAERVSEIQQGAGVEMSTEAAAYIAKLKPAAGSLPNIPMPTPLATWQPAGKMEPRRSSPGNDKASDKPSSAADKTDKPPAVRALAPSTPTATTVPRAAPPSRGRSFALAGLVLALVAFGFLVGARYMQQGPSATAAPPPASSPSPGATLVDPPQTPSPPDTQTPPQALPSASATTARAPSARPPNARPAPPRGSPPASPSRNDGLFDRY